MFLVTELSCFIRFSYRMAALWIASINIVIILYMKRGGVSQARSGESVYITVQKWQEEKSIHYKTNSLAAD